MEFFYDHKIRIGDRWTRKLNNENRFNVFAFHCVFPIPNFYETFKIFAETNYPQIASKTIQFQGRLPFVRDGDYLACCTIMTGEWGYSKGVNSNDFVVNASFDTSAIFEHIMLDQEKRLRKMEAIFDQIRGRSSVLDEFMALSEEVMKNDDTAIQGNAAHQEPSK